MAYMGLAQDPASLMALASSLGQGKTSSGGASGGSVSPQPYEVAGQATIMSIFAGTQQAQIAAGTEASGARNLYLVGGLLAAGLVLGVVAMVALKK